MPGLGGGGGNSSDALSSSLGGGELISDALATVSLVLKRQPAMVQRLVSSKMTEDFVVSILLHNAALPVRRLMRSSCKRLCTIR